MRSERQKKIAVAAAVLLLILAAKEGMNSPVEKGVLTRGEPGEGVRQEHLEALVDGESYEMKVQIEERQLTGKEAGARISGAKKEIDKTFLGKNRSFNRVCHPVVMKEVYQDGLVEAEWSLDRCDLMDTDGNFVKRDIAKAGELVTARVQLFCFEEAEEYRFSFRVYPPKQSVKEQIETALEQEEEKSRTKTALVLPGQAGGKEIRWKKQSSHIFLKLLMLGAVVGALLKARGLEEERKKKKEREECLLLYYPQLVTTLALLVGAGMPVLKAWERMTVRYRMQKKEKNEVYEELCYTWNEIKDGVGEKKAYENFGNRCALPQYKKLSSILTQNLRKGGVQVAELLSKEAEQALEKRKNTAKKLGEEAGTKMLMPMILMLGIVMVIVIVPAVIGFR